MQICLNLIVSNGRRHAGAYPKTPLPFHHAGKRCHLEGELVLLACHRQQEPTINPSKVHVVFENDRPRVLISLLVHQIDQLRTAAQQSADRGLSALLGKGFW